MARKIIGGVLIGGGFFAGFYSGRTEENLTLGTIIAGIGYTFGTLFVMAGYEIWFEKRAKDFEQVCEKKSREAVREITEEFAELKEDYSKIKKELEGLAKNNSN